MIYFVPRNFNGLDPLKFGRFTGIHDNGISQMIRGGFAWAADNRMFTGAFREFSNRKAYGRGHKLGWWDWLTLMLEVRETCKFVVIPDVIRDANATIKRFPDYAPRIKAMGYPVAFVAQDGQENLPLPDDYDALFIGGSTNWKLGLGAKRLMLEAKARGKWVHMGRVNSRSRIAYCRSLGIDSVDGTHVIYEPDKAIERIKSWMTEPNYEIALRSITEAQQQMVML